MNRIYKVNDNKFKGISISYNLTMPIIKNEVAANATLASLLSKGSKKYKSQTEIDTFLARLYGAKFETNVEKIGDLYNIEFSVEFANKKFLPENVDLLDDILCFLMSIIYEPDIKNNEFNCSRLDQEKKYILDKINEKKDDKLVYGIIRSEELLCKDEPFGVYVYGNEEDIAKITSKNLYELYKNIIKNSLISITIVGNLDGYENIEDKVYKIFKEYLNENINETMFNINIPIKKQDKIIDIKENSNIMQSVLTLGLKIDDFQKSDEFGFLIYNAILGSTPSSKLFQNVREKNSFCYAIRSRYYRYKSMIIIYAGIENKNYEKAKQSIIEEIQNMKTGNISEDEFNASKQSIISDILQWSDNMDAIAKFKLTNILNYGMPDISIDDIITQIRKVTKEQIIQLAKKVNINLIYLLGGEVNA